MTPKNEEKSADTALQWRGNAPVCNRFDDVYYSAENGLEETRFVFLKGIGAPEIWEDRDHVVIAETGFGTGLNFLATWQAWRASGAKGRLTFISTEGFPLTEDALSDAHATFPELANLAAALRCAWPPNAPGFHPRSFDGGKVRLLLLFGDAAESLGRLQADVDAWFLDGFAPAKNPDMWSDALMDQIARLSRVGTRFATFTAAGFVRRALQARGFYVEKQPGYGRKRERLVGVSHARHQAPATVSPPEWATLAIAPEGKIGVIGGGIAGAALAADLTMRGRAVTLIDPNRDQGASHVPAAILAPRFMLEKTAAAEVFSSAYALSCCYPAYEDAWADAPGVEFLPKNTAEAERYNKLLDHLGWTSDWLQPTQNGLRLPRGGSLGSQSALENLRATITDHVNADVSAISRTAQGWSVETLSGETLEFDIVVVACGVFTAGLLGDLECPEIRPNKGQVEVVSPRHVGFTPEHSIAFGGYVTAEVDGKRTIGSTFDKTTNLAATPSSKDRSRIFDGLSAVLEDTVSADVPPISWAGVRATTPDHLPYAGPVIDTLAATGQYEALAKDAGTTGLGPAPLVPGLYILSGLGSKGFQYGPLMADFLAAQICGDPLPLPLDTAACVHPARDLVRRIKRGKA